MRNRFTDFCLAVLITSFYWVLSRTWRLRHLRRPVQKGQRKPLLFAHWHGDELLLVGAYAFEKMAVMSSRSRDGLLMARVLSWLGFRVSRGSSSRGGAGGLKGLIDAVAKGGYDGSLAVDGPRGPIYRVKAGILKFAQQTGVPIVPGAAAASSRFVFRKAWNRCYLPLPFAKGVVVYGEPVRVGPELGPEELEKLRLQIENTLKELKREAESQFSRELSVELSPKEI